MQPNGPQVSEGFVVEPAMWRVWLLFVVTLPIVASLGIVSVWMGIEAPEILATSNRENGAAGAAMDFAGIVLVIVMTAVLAFSAFVILKIALGREEILRVTADGVFGRGFFRQKMIPWREIERIYPHRGTIRIMRAKKRSPWKLGFDEDCVSVSTFFIKKNADELIADLQELAAKQRR
jgi:hypothetical protein